MTRQPDVVTLRRLDWSRSDEELAEALGQPVQLIKAWRGKAFWRRGRIDSPPPWLVERWREQARTHTLAELAALWGVPRSTARGRVRRHDLPVKRSEAQPQPWAKPRRDVERMRREAEGRTVKELAALWGVSKQRAHQLVTRHGLPARVRRRKRRTPSE